ncbi:probable 28S ribosomal protein S25, mitochondrial [Amphibalanus amphitrite]|uniref:probable 28S ribosomal protein S25, mitochondrial n=1 Tax=Amphibalanus amphitrite TaxID=1232801 RepID=UPI001C902126|nr:probable 28S ribosomal protein S25, mitochondrial [Amphibalanus amphitrite]
MTRVLCFFRDFLHWYTPQIQYKNPNVQLVAMKDMMPSPFIRLFLDGDEEVIVDAEGKTKEDILSHLTKILGKSQSVLAAEEKEAQIVENKSNFGVGCGRYCICEVPGQVPCPSVVPLPKAWRGKYKTATWTTTDLCQCWCVSRVMVSSSVSNILWRCELIFAFS